LTTHRYVEKRSYNRGIELGPRAASELLSSVSRRHRTFVRANSGHDLKGIGHGDDSRAEGNLIARDAIGISGPVEILVMLLYGESPLSQPLTEWFNHSLTFKRMLVEKIPLGG
jgi:hypothetical protein